MDRRQLLRRAAFTGVVLSVGSAGTSQASSVDDADAESYETLDSTQFPETVSVAWIVDRFIQVADEDAPVVGHELETTGFVVERIETPAEYETVCETFDWELLDYTGVDAFENLFSPVAWPLEQTLPESFFDEYALLWLTGTTQRYYREQLSDEETAVSTDQSFYDLYGHTPFLFATIERLDDIQPGTVVDLSATVRHPGGENGPIERGDGGYLEITSIEEQQKLRLPNNDWEEESDAQFTGLQYHLDPAVSTAKTQVEYEDNLPRPQGGSLVTKEGQALNTDSGTDTFTEHTLDSDDHEMVVGQFLGETWEDGTGEEPDETDQTQSNISVIIDTSGSMSERDTGVTQNDQDLSRMELARISTVEFFDFLEDSHMTSLVEFNSNAQVVKDTELLTEESRKEFTEAAEALSEGGRTTIGGGLQTGFETIQDQQGQHTILLMSDGIENEGPMVSDVLPELRSQGVTIYTIGMGEDIDEEQLQRIAEETGGDSKSSPDPGEVRDFFQQMSGPVQNRPAVTERVEEVDEGDVVEDECQVDESCEDVQFALSYEGSDMDLVVTDPTGQSITEEPEISHRSGDAHEVWTIQNPPPGEWNYRVEVNQVDEPQVMRTQVTSDSPIDSELFISDELYEQTGFLRIQYRIDDGLGRYTGATARVEIETPDGDSEQIDLYDDGGGADDVPDDGIYSNYYHPTTTGEYQFTAVAEGGEFDNLQREQSIDIEVETVIDEPILPFEEESSLLNLLLLFGGVTAIGYYLYQRYVDNGQQTDQKPARGRQPHRSKQTSQNGGTQAVNSPTNGRQNRRRQRPRHRQEQSNQQRGVRRTGRQRGGHSSREQRNRPTQQGQRPHQRRKGQAQRSSSENDQQTPRSRANRSQAENKKEGPSDER